MTHGTWRGAWIRGGLSLAAIVVALVPAALMFNAHPLFLLGSLVVVEVLFIPYMLNQLVRVSVGADGIRVRRLLGRARFVPFSSIEDADTDGRDIEIRLNDRQRILMHHPSARGWWTALHRDHACEGRKLVERIREQLAAHRARTNEHAPALARGGRDTDTWLRAVTTAADAHASFRTSAVPPDVLWRIVEDIAAPPTARAGAAVALREALDDGGRVRLRVLADACAASRLRVALEAVASDQDVNGLRRALDPLDDHELESVSRTAER